jgi:hypothetical protein
VYKGTTSIRPSCLLPYTIIEAVGSTGTYVALVLLTNPGNTCLFPKGVVSRTECGSNLPLTSIPPLYSYVILGTISIAAFVAAQLGDWLRSLSATCCNVFDCCVAFFDPTISEVQTQNADSTLNLGWTLVGKKRMQVR